MDFDGMEEYDFDGKMDFDGMEEYDFDGKMDFDGMEEYDFEPSLDLSEADEYDFEPSLDFSKMDHNDEEKRLEPTGESDSSLEPEEDGDINDKYDPSSDSSEQENEPYENVNSESTSTVLISENVEKEGKNLENDDQDHEEIEEIDQDELEKEIEREFEEGLEGINQHLEEEAKFINAYQEMVGKERELDEERAREGEEPLKTEEEWEKEVETAAYTAEQLYESTKEIEADINTEEISEINEELEIEKEAEQNEEVLEPQLSDLKEDPSELAEEGLEFEEGERDEIEQHQVEPLIEEALETEPEPIVNDKEIEQLQELDLEEQFQTVDLNEYIEELVEKQEEEKTQEYNKIEQELENVEQTQEVLHQSPNIQEKLEEPELELERDHEEKDEVEQHQVEAAIEEELETELKPIINEEELKYVKNFELEEQLDAELLYELIEELAKKQNEEKEEREENEEQEEISVDQKVSQIMRELELSQEINSGETEVEINSQERELEQETTTQDEEVVEQREIEEGTVHQQELEEILEEISKIEQEALDEIAPGEEQKNEETWNWTLKNWIDFATEIDPELKSELKKLVEKYNGLEKLIKKYKQLYIKAKSEELSQAEKKELKSLRKALQKLDSIKFELFQSIREMKHYIKGQYYYDFWDKTRVNQKVSYFFTYLSQKYSSLKQLQKMKNNTEKVLKSWIEEVSEEEISSEIKAELKELIENYNELDAVAIMFMKLYTKAQSEILSKIEQKELHSLVRTLQKIDPSKIELFTKIRAIKHYLNDQNSDDLSNKARVNRLLNQFFVNFSQKYKNLISGKHILQNKTINFGKMSQQEFLEYCKANNDNFYSERFRNLDLNRYKSSDVAIAEELRTQFVKQGYVPYNVYEFLDTKTGYIRVGYSGGTDEQRKKWYIDRSFAKELIPKGWGNIYRAIKECKSKQEANTRFQMVIKYVTPSIGEAKILEEYLTIYRNRADNDLGYDLTINNEYNKIVGDLFKGKDIDGNLKTTLTGDLAHNWKGVPPIQLAKAVLDGLGTQEISDLFKVSTRTVRRRFKTYGYGVREVFDLKDARAFLLKPYIIEGFKKGLTQEKFFDFCEREGIKIFKKYNFIKNKANDRGAFFRRMLEQIWGKSKHKEARYQVIADYIVSIITRPDITPGQAETDLREIITFKYDNEFARICRDVFGKDFRKKRDEIFKPRIEHLALKYKDEKNIRLKIAIELGLCTYNDDVNLREKASGWIKNYVRSNYGISVGRLPNLLINKKV